MCFAGFINLFLTDENVSKKLQEFSRSTGKFTIFLGVFQENREVIFFPGDFKGPGIPELVSTMLFFMLQILVMVT